MNCIVVINVLTMSNPNHVLVMLMISFFECEQKMYDDLCSRAYRNFQLFDQIDLDRKNIQHRKNTRRAWNAYIRVANEVNTSGVEEILIVLRAILKS